MMYRESDGRKRGGTRRSGEYVQPVVSPSFVKYLAAKRKSLGISLTLASRVLGLSPAGLCNKEAGRFPLYRDESLILQRLFAESPRTGGLFDENAEA